MKLQNRIDTTLNTIATARCINLKNTKNVSETDIEIEKDRITIFYNETEFLNDFDQNYNEKFLHWLSSNIELLINKDTDLLINNKKQKRKNNTVETVYLIADTTNGVSKKVLGMEHKMLGLELKNEETFYNYLTLLNDSDVIYCKFVIDSEFYKKIDKEYGIY